MLTLGGIKHRVVPRSTSKDSEINWSVNALAGWEVCEILRSISYQQEFRIVRFYRISQLCFIKKPALCGHGY